METVVKEKEKQKKEILKLLKRMYTITEISMLLHVDKNEVKKIIMELNEEGLWNIQIKTALKEKLMVLIYSDKTTEEICKETGVSYEYIVQFKSKLEKDEKNNPKKREYNLKQFETLLKNKAPLNELLRYRSNIPKYWIVKANKMLIRYLWEEGLEADEINFSTGIDYEEIKIYCREFDDELKNLNVAKEREKLKRNDPIYKERQYNDKCINAIKKKMMLGKDEPKDLEITRKVIKTYNFSFNLMDELIKQLINTEKYNKIKVAEYGLNVMLSDENLDNRTRIVFQKQREDVKKYFKKTEEKIAKLAENGVSTSEIAKKFGIDERYVMQIRGLYDCIR